MSLDDKGEASITHDRKAKGNPSLCLECFHVTPQSLLNIGLGATEISPVIPPPTTTTVPTTIPPLCLPLPVRNNQV